MSKTVLATFVEFSNETAHRRFMVTRLGDGFVLQLHTIWDRDGSETNTEIFYPLEALGPLASLFQSALSLPPPDDDA